MTHEQFIGIIPARAASTRLPRKMLADIAGQPMVIRTASRALQSDAAQVYIATDDPEIFQAATQHGCQVLMTRPDHASGTDRLSEVCQLLSLPDNAIVVNIQGDEPLIEPQLINDVARTLSLHPQSAMATAACPIADPALMNDPNCVKVVTDHQGNALYFSRAPIPFRRAASEHSALLGHQHIGVYAYRAAFLRAFPRLSASRLESMECLEQLRALEHGFRIQVHLSDYAPHPGVDAPADLESVRKFFESAAG